VACGPIFLWITVRYDIQGVVMYTQTFLDF
jgi:hypothetical protein